MVAAEPQVGQGPEPETPQAPPAGVGATEPQTITREQYERDLDRERNRFGQANKLAEELKARLAELEEAGKTEAEKVAAKAAEYDALLPRVKALEKALKSELEAIRPQLTEELQELIHAEAPVEAQLAQAKKLLAAQQKLAGQPPPPATLPEPGSRNPARSVPGVDDKRAFDEAQELYPTLSRMVPARRGP